MLNEDSVTGQVAMDDGRITGVKITAYQKKRKRNYKYIQCTGLLSM